MSLARNDSADGQHDAESCKALGNILDRIGDKWTVMVVGILSDGPMRFNALQRTVAGVSHRMLTLTLRGLERDGLVTRTAFATVPPRVDYELTDLGHSLRPQLELLASWARTHQATIEQARNSFDQRSLAKSSE
ncbi:HxlR family transcriptional regulator [Pseudomonas cichorii]|uniref:winged helix-turn-helix transcriptional regulator n=1 Tax=Pseudomonas cichorii TaxID=36746 RepID=UPI0019101929|nr:helix-turn-helix domain-containing protein [Pseudomonas cichorii]GFM84799.1 HxlR family transcriptional regulator [Pseudomonas cichorii]